MKAVGVLAAHNVRAVALAVTVVYMCTLTVLVTETPDNITSRHLPVAVMEATVDTALFNLEVMATQVSGTNVTLGLKTCC